MAQSDENAYLNPDVYVEKPGFDPERLIHCERCSRTNAPNRLRCLYCNSDLDANLVEPAQVKASQLKAAAAERGFNLVAVGGFDADRKDLSGAANVLSMEPAALEKILSTETMLPLCRLQSENDAASICMLLKGLGIETDIVDDAALQTNKPPVRLGGIDLSGDKILLTLFNSRERVALSSEGIVLLVEGVVFTSRVDQIEQRKRRGRSQMSEGVATTADELILDIYPLDDMLGYRVPTAGFDFSWLGAEKGLFAADNLKKLAEKLVERCPAARVVSDYRHFRREIGDVWEVVERRDTGGMSRSGLGKSRFTSVITTSNLDQFNRFSRLQRYML